MPLAASAPVADAHGAAPAVDAERGFVIASNGDEMLAAGALVTGARLTVPAVDAERGVEVGREQEGAVVASAIVAIWHRYRAGPVVGAEGSGVV